LGSALVLVDANDVARAEATDFARRLVLHWADALGTELLGGYLIGSLAHAGFSWRYSDIDVALVTAAGLPEQVPAGLRDQAVARSPRWGPKVSLFWTDRHFVRGRFPLPDRIDYLDHAVAVTERERVRPERPALADIRQYLSGDALADWVDRALRLAAAKTLEPKEHKACVRVFLYPARFCYTWLTGRIGSNDDAVSFLANRHVARLDLGSISRALECRCDAADPVALFGERTVLWQQIDACTTLVSGGGN
jgi:hypothetical protein